jgi:hypothetical protein
MILINDQAMPPGGRERRGLERKKTYGICHFKNPDLRGPQNGARRYVNRPEVCVPDAGNFFVTFWRMVTIPDNWVFDLGAGFCPDEFSEN